MTVQTEPTKKVTFRARLFDQADWINIYTDKEMTDEELFEDTNYRCRTYGEMEYPFEGVRQWRHDGFVYQLTWNIYDQ